MKSKCIITISACNASAREISSNLKQIGPIGDGCASEFGQSCKNKQCLSEQTDVRTGENADCNENYTVVKEIQIYHSDQLSSCMFLAVFIKSEVRK